MSEATTIRVKVGGEVITLTVTPTYVILSDDRETLITLAVERLPALREAFRQLEAQCDTSTAI